MHDGLIDDLFNPRFVYFSPVHLDELTTRGFLDRTGFAPHVDAAIAAWQINMEDKSEQCFGVRDINVETLTPVVTPVVMRVDVWVERIDATRCTFGFLCSSESGNVAFARGDRSIMKLDPRSHQPASWSAQFRARHQSLQKELPAYA